MYLPIGCITNVIFIVIAGIIGTFLGKYISEELKEKIPMVFAVCSFAMGFGSIGLMKNMPAVVLSLNLGTIIGVLIKMGHMINRGATYMQKVASKVVKIKSTKLTEKEAMSLLVSLIVIFCFGSTGLYGSLVSGMTGN